MSLYALVAEIWLLFLIALIMYFDFRRPLSTYLRNKCRVKDNSILRKVLKCKDRENNPCNYFKIIPVCIYFILGLISVILLVINLATGGLILSKLGETVFQIIAGVLVGISLLYVVGIIIWWDVVDAKYCKMSKEENKVLKDVIKKIK